MATQAETGITFAIGHKQQNFRLLELPPDLLELITSQKPPSLFLKSSVTSATTPANAVLCTDSRTYQVRQVHSSNSVFVLQPSEIASNTSDEITIPDSGLSAIARCSTTLELIPATLSALALLRSKLPVYDSPRTELPSEQSAKTVAICDKRNKSAIYEDTPLSLQEYEKAWEELCAFEMDSTCWIPTAASLYGAWRSIMSALTLKGLKLQDSLYADDIAAVVEEDGIPAALFQAIIQRLRLENVIPMDGCMSRLDVPDIPYSVENGTGATLNPDICVQWVGAVVLNSTHQPEGITRSDFMQQWQNLLPEAWRKHATLSLLNGMYSNPSKDRIMSGEAETLAGSPGSAEPVNTSGRRPGKWHEKFKNARR